MFYRRLSNQDGGNMRNAVLNLRLCSALLALIAYPIVGAWAAPPFDGYWGVTLDCPNDASGATGYTMDFRAEVRDSVFHGQNRTPGTPGSFALDGKIEPDGSASLTVNGRTGQSFYTVGHVPPNTPYSYHVTARFLGSQ